METDNPTRWSDRSLLKSLKNPSNKPYRIVIKNPEVTFLGVHNQPDFAKVTLIIIPGERILELKSLKEYFVAFRNKVISYERFVNILFDDLAAVYSPLRIKVVARFRPRGGISSTLIVDSKHRNPQT